MKYLVPLLLVVIIATSCHKSHSSDSAPDATPLNGLTGTTFESESHNGMPPKYVTWSFSGTNPILASSGADSSYLGSEQLFFTGANATSVVYYKPSVGNINITIQYNSANMPDTVSISYPSHAFYWGYAFEYTSGQITKITQASRSGLYPFDTLRWSAPNAYYYYSYSGQNVSQMVIQQRDSYPDTTYSSRTYYYTTGTLKNNLAGSFPLYFLLESIKVFDEGGDFAYDLPMYLSANVIAGFEYFTDQKGRIVMRVSPPQQNYPPNAFDTVIYHY